MIKVKELDWNENEASSPVGHYRCQRLGDKWEPLRNGYFMLTKWHGIVKAFDTIEEAKAAAQSDYERRILSALSVPVPVPAQEAEPFAWYWHDDHGCLCIAADSRKPEFPEAVNPLYLHPTPAHSGEREALERAASQLVNSELAQQIRKLVSGWNGDGVAEEYRMGRHDDALGVTLPTNCGAIYMLDEVIHELRAALEGKQP